MMFESTCDMDFEVSIQAEEEGNHDLHISVPNALSSLDEAIPDLKTFSTCQQQLQAKYHLTGLHEVAQGPATQCVVTFHEQHLPSKTLPHEQAVIQTGLTVLHFLMPLNFY